MGGKESVLIDAKMSLEQSGDRVSLAALFDYVKETVESMFRSGSGGSKKQGPRNARYDQELASLLRRSSGSGPGLRKAPGVSFGSVECVSFENQFSRVTLSIDGMHCSSCSTAVEAALSALAER